MTMSDYDEGAMDERSGWETAARELLDALPTVWQGSAEAVRLRLLLNERPTEPTEADPPFNRYATTIDSLLERVDAWVESVEGTPAPWALVGDMADLLRRLRALVGGRPAAPTRDDVGDFRDAVVVLLNAVADVNGLRAYVTAEWDAVQALLPRVALLSRSAAEPPGEVECAECESTGQNCRAHRVFAPTEQDIRSAAEGITMAQRIEPVHIPTPDAGVAAEPKEHGDGA